MRCAATFDVDRTRVVDTLNGVSVQQTLEVDGEIPVTFINGKTEFQLTGIE